MRKAYVFGGIITIAMVLTVFIVLQSRDLLSPELEADTVFKLNAAKAKETRSAHDSTQGHDHELEDLLIQLASTPGVEAHYDFNADRFDVSGMQTERGYAASETKLVVDASCASRSDRPDPAKTLESQLQQQHGMDGRRRVPDDIFFESLTQFFQVNGRYYQLSAYARAASRPPVYEIEFYRADDSGLQAGLIREALPVNIPSSMDAITVANVFSNVLAHYQSPTFVEGARLMDVRIAGREGEQDQAIRYFNALPVQWVFAGGVCQLSAKKNTSHCRCLPDKEVLKAAEY